MATTKWFNLAGAKEAYLQDVKLRWVDDANLSIPWLHFYLRSALNWDFFTLTFPDQAWILKQLLFIDRDVDEGLAALQVLVPSSCRPQSCLEGSNDNTDWSREFVPLTVFDYYRRPAAVSRQQAVILYYTRYLEFDRLGGRESELIQNQAFSAACVELVEGPCWKERAKLVEELLSPENSAALLSAQPSTETPIWHVRREVVRRGLVIKKAMQQMRDALGLEEEEEEDEEDEDDRKDEVKTQVLADVDGEKDTSRCDPESDDRCPTPRDLGPEMDTRESRCDRPLHGCASCGTILEDEWASVVEEDESYSC